MTNAATTKRLTLILLAGIAIFFVLFLALAAGTGYFLYTQAQTFSQHAGISLSETKKLAKQAWNKQPIATNGHKNILILGVDSLDARGNAPPLTDTMMVASVNLESGKINTLSLPRDLWSPQYQTKINALYYYGQDRYPNNPTQFPQETLEETLNIPLHHTVVISMDSLAQLVDMLGGIPVKVPVGFTDTEFPRPNVDVTSVEDPDRLYKTVSFTAGEEIMGGQRVLEYIRSRHSQDEQGHDLARSQRQQQIINALMKELISRKTLTNPALLGDLFKYYQDNYSQYIPLAELGAVGKQLLPVRQNISFNPHAFTIYPDSEAGVLVHPPPAEYNGQWVYVIRDQDQLQAAAKNNLYDQ